MVEKMKMLNDREKEIVKWLIANNQNGSISLEYFLEKFFFLNDNNSCLVIQAKENYAMYFLKTEIFNQNDKKNRSIALLIEAMSLLNYLNYQGYITVFREEHNVQRDMYYFGTLFLNPYRKDNKIILNPDGLHSIEPRTIQDKDNEIVYKGIEFKNDNYNLIFQYSIGNIYISESIEKLIAPSTESREINLKEILFHAGTLLISLIILLFTLFIFLKQDDLKKELFKIEKNTVLIHENQKEIVEKQITLQKTKTVHKNQTLHYGIDISRWNGKVLNLSFNKKIEFVICKATEGLHMVDPMFKHNWKKIKKKNLTRGAYHFFLPQKDALEQAEHFWKTISDLKTDDIAPILDVERGIKKMSTKLERIDFQVELLLCLKHLEKLSNRVPIIYCDLSFANDYLTHKNFAHYPLWIAEYTSRDKAKVPKTWKNKGYLMWQKSDKYDIHSTHEDFDVYVGELPMVLKSKEEG